MDLPGIQCQTSATDGIRWTLPPRDLGPARRLGWIGVGIGTVMTLFMLGWLANPLRALLSESGTFRAFMSIFVLAGLGGLYVAMRILSVGLTIVRNRTYAELRLRDTELRCTEHFGGWRIKRSFDISLAEQIVVSEALKALMRDAGPAEAVEQANKTQIDLLPQSLRCGLVIRSEVKDFVVTAAYDKALLLGLANDLTAHLPGRLPVLEEEEPEEAPTDQDSVLPEPPPWTAIHYEPLPTGCAFAVPRMGLFKGSHGLAGVGLAFTLLPLVFLVVLMVAAVKSSDATLLGVAGFLLLFLAVGVSLLVWGIKLGLRKSYIAVMDQRLSVREQDPFGERERSLHAREILSLARVATGTEVNGKPLYRIEVVPQAGKKLTMLGQVSEEEQEWVAAHLRRALSL